MVLLGGRVSRGFREEGWIGNAASMRRLDRVI